MNFEITGKLLEKFDVQQVSEKFKKREFVIERNENNFPEFIKFQLVQDKTDLIDVYNKGEEIKVHFNIRGNKWKESYFVNLQAWKIERTGEKTAKYETPAPVNEDFLTPPITEDDLPF
jgi:hypothetical protein